MTEGRSPDGEDFGMARLLDLVDRPHTSAGQLRDDVLSAIAAWTQGQFDDDVTLLAVVRRDGTNARSRRRRSACQVMPDASCLMPGACSRSGAEQLIAAA